MKRKHIKKAWLTDEEEKVFQKNKKKLDPALSDAEFIRKSTCQKPL